MSTHFRTSADASKIYRQSAAIQIARCTSSAETGNLAAVTKDSTFEVDGPVVIDDGPTVKAAVLSPIKNSF